MFETRKQLLDYLLGFITDHKKQKIEDIIVNRTKYLTVVLEDIYQPHNASAVLRSCDCFGIQDIHIIENVNKYNVNPDVALGSSKWVTINKYSKKENNTADCIQSLKVRGYKIVATLPDEKYPTLEELKFDKKVALIFGTEAEGLTEGAIQSADEYVRIKMYGFTESFNISVSVALCLHYLSTKLRESNIDWRMSEEEKLETSITWVKNIVKRSDLLEKEFYKNIIPK